MKTVFLALATFACLALPLLITSCEKEKGPGEKIGEKIDDALDQRPGEKVKDAIEDVGDAVKEAVK
jgi:hypothetical protein